MLWKDNRNNLKQMLLLVHVLHMLLFTRGTSIATRLLWNLNLHIFYETKSCTYDYHSKSCHQYMRAFCNSTRLEFLCFCKWMNCLPLLFSFSLGNADIFPFSKHSIKCCLIFDTSYIILGLKESGEKQKSTTFAIAKSPQSWIRLLLNAQNFDLQCLRCVIF